MGKSRSIGGILVELLLSDKDFNTKMRRASKLAKEQAGVMAKSFMDVSKRMAAAGAIGAGALSAGVVLAIKNIDDLAKQADRLGVTTEALAALRYQAGLSGVETGTLEKGMEKISKSAWDAASGIKLQADMFASLGINVNDFLKLPIDQQMGVMADKLNGLTNANERAAVAQSLFGKSGRDMLTMMAGGSEAMAATAREAEMLGLVLSRVDAAKVEAANDAMGRVQEAGQGLFDQLAVKLAPVISEVGERIIGVIDDWGGMGAIAETVMQGIITGVGMIADAFWGWELIWKGLKVGFKGLELFVQGVVSGMTTTFEGFINATMDKINVMIKALNKLPKVKIAELSHADFASGAVDAFEESRAEYEAAKKEFNDAVAKGPVSDRMLVKLFETQDKWEKVAEKTAKAADAAKTFGDATVAANMKAQMATAKTAKAIKDVNTELLSMQEVADKGGKSENARLAKQALKLREKADQLEAQGRFDAADRMNKRADDLEAKVKRRERVGNLGTTDAAAKMRVDAKKAEQAGNSDKADELNAQAAQLEGKDALDFSGLSQDEKDAKRAELQRKIEEAHRNGNKTLEQKLQTQKDFLEGKPVKAAEPPTVGSDGTVVDNMDQNVPATREEGATGKTSSVLEKLEELIDLLTALPGKVGVA